MIRPRTVGDTWTVPPALAALVAAGMLGAIVTVYTGNHDQATPKVPQPASATVVQIRYSNVRGQPVRLDAADARTLASLVNNLPRMPLGDYKRGADIGRANEIQFTRGSKVTTVASPPSGGNRITGASSQAKDTVAGGRPPVGDRCIVTPTCPPSTSRREVCVPGMVATHR